MPHLRKAGASFSRIKGILDALDVCLTHSNDKKVCRKLVKTCDLFWCTLKAFVHDTNCKYMENEKQCRFKFEMLNIHTLRSPRLLGIAAIQEAIQQAMAVFSSSQTEAEEATSEFRMRKIEETLRRIASAHLQSVVSTEEYFSELHKFFEVCFMVDEMRKLVMDSYMIISDAINRFEGLTEVKVKSKFLRYVEEEAFYCSPMISRLHTSLECLAGYMAFSQNFSETKSPEIPVMKNFLGSTPTYICRLCNSVLKHPVVLTCSHRFCMCCLENMKPKISCPVCEKPISFSSLKVDSVLEQFITTHFPHQASQPCDENKCGGKGCRKRNSSCLNVARNDIVNSFLRDGLSAEVMASPCVNQDHISHHSSSKSHKDKKTNKIFKITGNIQDVISHVTGFHIRCWGDEAISDPRSSENRQERHYNHNHSSGSKTQDSSGSKYVKTQEFREPSTKRQRLTTNFECLTNANCSATHMPQIASSDVQVDDWLDTLNPAELIHEQAHDTSSFFYPDMLASIRGPPGDINLSPQLLGGNPVEEFSGSCHQCKLRCSSAELVRCSSKSGCRKKYCRACLRGKYNISLDQHPVGFECPACKGFCTCAACVRKNPRKHAVKDSLTASCHQCKLKKPKVDLTSCTTMIRNRRCKKKYCKQCLVRYKGLLDLNKTNWQCPACAGICTCAHCKKKRAAALSVCMNQGSNSIGALTSLT